MKLLLVLLAATLSASVALAGPSRHPKARTAAKSDKALPLKGRASANSCAAYGAGFVRIEGSNTCIKIGGAIGIGGGISSGSR
jgi:hypothetical protein